MESASLAVEAGSLNHWTTREAPVTYSWTLMGGGGMEKKQKRGRGEGRRRWTETHEFSVLLRTWKEPITPESLARVTSSSQGPAWISLTWGMGRGLFGHVDKDVQWEDAGGCPEVVQKTSQDSSSRLQSGSWRSDERLRREDEEFREIFLKGWAWSWNNASSSFKKKRFIYLAMPSLSYGMWDLVPCPGMEPRSPVLGAWSLSPWTTREVLYYFFLHFECDTYLLRNCLPDKLIL